MKIRLQIKSSGSIDRRIGELDYFLQVLGIDLRYGMAVGFVLTISLVQIDLGEQCCSGSFGRTALVSLLLGQNVVGKLQVVSNDLPALVVGIFGVAQVVVIVLGHVSHDYKGYILVQALEQEVSVRPQEVHLSQALVLQFVGIIHAVQCIDSGIHAAEAVVQAHPHVVDIPVGGQDALRYLQLMKHVTVACAVAALVGVIAADIEVPHRETGVDVLCRDKDGVCGYNHVLHLCRIFYLILAQRCLRRIMVKKVATRQYCHAEY